MKATALSKFDSLMAAISFAEENEHTIARGFLDGEAHQNKQFTNNPELQKTRKKPVAAMILTGIISAALYGELLSNQDYLNSTFGKGGIFAFLPIITAFLFSYFHGTFTGHFWTMLGVEASKKNMEVK
jgi:hypothetical protein